MKTVKEELNGQARTLRYNEAVQDQIALAVLKADAVKDAKYAAELATLKLKNVKLITVVAKSDNLATYEEMIRTLAKDLEEC
jgi:pyruvate carboxylase